jgi:hypothetical protein
LEPNIWLNRLPIDGLESDELPNMLPPPHPDSTAPATPSASATRRWRAKGTPVAGISLLHVIEMSPKVPRICRVPEGKPASPARYNSVMAANPRRVS